jgi:GGDEF domain-containing protein
MSGTETAVWTAIATGTGCGLVFIDDAGLIEYMSPQLAEVSGVEADQIVGKSWAELVKPAGAAETDDAGAGLIDAAPVLARVTFYPVGSAADNSGRRVGVLRLSTQYVDYGEGFPFAVETAAGIPSRRALFELIQSQLACQDRYKTPFSLIFLRIKNYSTFIEALGTESWENTNRAVFDQLNAITRMADSVGLYDEATFWMILVNSAPEGTKVTAEKIKLLAGAMKIDALDLFLSVAVAGVMARPGEDSETLIQRGLVKLNKALDATSGMVVEE